MAQNPQSPDSDPSGNTSSQNSDKAKESETIPKPVAPIVVLTFELYFLLLGIAATYALWVVWPYDQAADTVRLFGFQLNLGADSDARLMLVAVFTGILGALIHVTTSFASYLGNRKLDGAWIPWFTLRPLIGASLGLLFYLIVRAGFVTSNGGGSVNPFGVAAAAGLAGLFSKQAVDKLRDVFENAFPVSKGGDSERKGNLNEGSTAGTPKEGTEQADSKPEGKNGEATSANDEGAKQ